MANRSILTFALAVALVVAAPTIFRLPYRLAAAAQGTQPADETAFVQAVIKGGSLGDSDERKRLIDKALPNWRISDWSGDITQYGAVVFTVRIGPGITLFMRQPPAENRTQLLEIDRSGRWHIDQRVRFSGEFVSGDNGYAKEAVAPGEIPKQPQFFFRFSRVEPLD